MSLNLPIQAQENSEKTITNKQLISDMSKDLNKEINSDADNSKKSEIKLYGGFKTRSTIIEWYLQELNISYEYISLNLSESEHLKPEYLAINPIGKVPAIVDKDFKLWESGAILLYIADKYQQIPDSIEYRAILNQWVLFANATLGLGLFLEDRREKEMPRLLTLLNDILKEQKYLVGNDFTVVDVAVASYLYYGQSLFKLDYSKYEYLVKYLNEIYNRPAFKNTLGKRFT